MPNFDLKISYFDEETNLYMRGNFEILFWSLKWTNLFKVYWITISLYSWMFWRIFFCFKALWSSENYAKVCYRSPVWRHFQNSRSPQYKALLLYIIHGEKYLNWMKRSSTFEAVISQKRDFFQVAYLISEQFNCFLIDKKSVIYTK